MTAATDSSTGGAPRKPRLSFLIATVFGLGYLKPGPGTWGSLAGIVIYAATLRCVASASADGTNGGSAWWLARIVFAVTVLIAIAGVLAADRVAKFSRVNDPQFVVIDEVSGQLLALLLGGIAIRPFFNAGLSEGRETYYGVAHLGLAPMPLNWKYLLLGFILFRAFDIWKPFPVRQAESLRGGLGIMADDWLAGVYAAAALWAARALGL
ncbi:MAG: phosphatidylglycerophosphatase A [Candidatus Acidiferrales bacterium]